MYGRICLDGEHVEVNKDQVTGTLDLSRLHAGQSAETMGRGSADDVRHLGERVSRGIGLVHLAQLVATEAPVDQSSVERVLNVHMQLGNYTCDGALVPALLADSAAQARGRLTLLVELFVLSVEAIRAPLDAYDERLEELWGDPFSTVALREIRGYLAGAEQSERRSIQAPVSYRILPRVLGQAYRVIDRLEATAERGLRAASTSPVRQDTIACPAIDTLTATWADLCTLAARHAIRVQDPAITRLPAGLFTCCGGGVGAATLALTVERARSAARRTTQLHSSAVTPSQTQPSGATMLAYEKERQAASALETAAAILAVFASQALWTSGRTTPKGLWGGLLKEIRDVCPPADAVTPVVSAASIADLADNFSRMSLRTASRSRRKRSEGDPTE
jgi:hypothetical protein